MVPRPPTVHPKRRSVDRTGAFTPSSQTSIALLLSTALFTSLSPLHLSHIFYSLGHVWIPWILIGDQFDLKLYFPESYLVIWKAKTVPGYLFMETPFTEFLPLLCGVTPLWCDLCRPKGGSIVLSIPRLMRSVEVKRGWRRSGLWTSQNKRSFIKADTFCTSQELPEEVLT